MIPFFQVVVSGIPLVRVEQVTGIIGVEYLVLQIIYQAGFGHSII
jgi:hypothetical protein